MKKTFKRLLASLMVAVMVLTAAPLSGFVGLELPNVFDIFASAESYNGTCGYNLTWTFDDETGELVISGTGDMCDYSRVGFTVQSDAPWGNYYLLIKKVTIEDGVTSIGDYAFYSCSGLASITIPDSVISIGSLVFYDCDSLTSITIPDGVTTIGDSAFSYCDSLTSIIIPDSVTTIGDSAFSCCDSLTSITIPDGVTTIGEYAFGSCDRLTSITLGSGVTTIGYSAFSYCDSLTSITIPDGVTTIGDSAFSYCDSLTSIIIPDSVTTIGDSAFSSCDRLTSITLGSGVTTIGDYAFRYCDSLKSITIPDGVITIGEYAFSSCYSLTSITIPDSVTTIGNSAFKYCDSLTSITIPDSVTTIGEYAFSDCDRLTSITLGSGVATIGEYAFEDCDSLTSITIPDGVTAIGDAAFEDCDSLTSITIPDSVTTIGNYAFRYCDSLKSITVSEGNTAYSSDEYSVLFNKDKTVLIQYPSANPGETYIIPDSVTTIGEYAFYGCENLTSITLPDSVTTIGDCAFRYCDSLKSITVSEGNTAYSSDEYGVLFNKDKTVLVQYPSANPGETYIIPDSVTAIGEYAFNNCDRLTSITLGSGVATIGESAFYSCDSLTSITIPDSVTTIGDYAFNNCDKIESAYYPGTHEQWEKVSVGYGNSYMTDYLIFEYNSEYPYRGKGSCGENLTWVLDSDGKLVISGTGDMTNYKNASSSSSSAPWYEYISSVRTVTIVEGVTTIGEYAFSDCDRLTSITIPAGVTAIGESAFRSCDSLTSITLGSGVTTIGDSVFSYCDSLTSIIIPDSVTTIGNYAFSHCDSLTSITIPDSVTIIGESAFYSCDSLTSITIPDGVTTIGEYAFSDCDRLTSIIIPDSVTTIGDSAFAGCYELTSIVIPEGVTSIGDDAFLLCINLEKIEVDPDNTAFITDEYGVMYNADKTDIVAVPLGKKIEHYVIPAGVQNEEAYTNLLFFGYISEVKSFAVEEGNEMFSTDEYGVLYNKDKTQLICYPPTSEWTHYTVPSTVKTCYYAFIGANNLTVLEFAEGVEAIAGSLMFCENLKTVKLPSTLTEFDECIFTGCANLEKIIVSEDNPYYSTDDQGVLYNKDKTAIYYVPAKGIAGSYVMPNTVEIVIDHAFMDCRDFTMTLSDALESFDFLCFVSVNEFAVTENNPYLTTVDGVLYDKALSILVKYPIDSDRELFVVPNTVEYCEFDEFTFVSCNSKYLLMQTEFTLFELSDYCPINVPEALTTVHTETPIEILIGPEHVFVSGVTEDDIEQYNAYIQEIEDEYKEIIEERNDYLEFTTAYKIYKAMELFTDLPDYALCSGDHTELHPKFVERERVEPDCMNDGYSLRYCADCDEEYTVVLKSDGHKYESSVTEPTCVEEGYTTYTCSCGDTYTTDYVSALGHKHVELEYNPVVTCTTAGEKLFRCHCGDEYVEIIPATGHNPVYVRVEPTCLENGYECYKCEGCSTEYMRVEIEATGHSYVEEKIKEPTCAKSGSKRFTCSSCGDSYDETIPATGEHKIKTIIKAPTCTSFGFEQYQCEVCGNMIGDMVFIPKVDHLYSDVKIITVPTATENGSKEQSCAYCGKTETVTIPALGFEATDGMAIDFVKNIITGLNAGETSLDGYMSLVNEAYTWEYVTSNGKLGTGSKAILKDGETVVGEYTILIYGDVTGDSWYDGQDAIIVDCLANGMLTKADVGEAVYKAADCNHDGVIDQHDVDLLNQAGTLLANVDQSKPAEVLLETSSEYVEYLDLIDQSPEIDVEGDMTTEDEDISTENEESTTLFDNSFFVFVFDLISIIKSTIDFILGFVNA